MKPLEFSAPSALDDALSLLAGEGGSAGILAGGTDLIIQHRAGRKDIGHMIDIKKIPEGLISSFHAMKRAGFFRIPHMIFLGMPKGLFLNTPTPALFIGRSIKSTFENYRSKSTEKRHRKIATRTWSACQFAGTGLEW